MAEGRVQMLRDVLRDADPPRLGRRNGVGFALLGAFYSDDAKGYYFSIVWFTFFFLPIFPVGIYLVRGLDKQSNWRGDIASSLRLHDFRSLYPGALTKIIVAGVFESLGLGLVFIVAGTTLLFALSCGRSFFQ